MSECRNCRLTKNEGRSMARSFIAAVFLASVPSGQMAAHDLWLIPPEKAAPGKPVSIKASVGMDFPKSEKAHDTSRYPERLVVGPDGKRRELKAAGKDDKESVGLLEFAAEEPGIYAV